MKNLLLSSALLCLLSPSNAQSPEPPVASLLKDTGKVSPELIKGVRSFRERLLADPYRPAFHFSFPEDDGRPGDPNGAFYHNGLYHLMYLYKKTGSGFAWGHVSSPDLLHWRYHPDAIEPGNGDDGCFSGGAFVDSNGTATLSYWMLWGAKGIGLAKSTDANFDRWQKIPENPVIASTEWGITEMKGPQGEPMHIGSADPSNIWQKDGKYFMLTGNLLVLNKYGRKPESPLSERGDRLYLFESKDLTSWQYRHRFYERNPAWTDDSEDNMCPSFLPLPSNAQGGAFSGKHLLLFISHNKGCQYYIGTYRNDRFFPETHGRMTWTDNAYFAPEALVDDKGRQVMWSWIFDDRPDSLKLHYGWNGIYGLPRTLWLGEDNTLRMQPVKELENIRRKAHSFKALQVKPAMPVPLTIPPSDLLEIECTIRTGQSSKAGIMVNCSEDGREKTIIYYDQKAGELVFDASKSSLSLGRRSVERAPLKLKQGEDLRLRVFVDRGIVEVFANNRQAIGRTVYPQLNGKGVYLFSEGGQVAVTSARAYELNAANPF